ncbi:MAG: PSD1 and planctomycete cytochrome C domain-containing protein [Acidobacteria bacterium]|nr:PSD1 and planctomycete cytochrome C domain-containing protein [Acidobacteriota bacterium]
MTHCTVLLLALALRIVAQPVSFDSAIKPVLETTCLKCHGAQAMAGLDLRSREAALKVITPGQAEASRLYKVVAGIEKPAMPMGATLTAAQIDSIRRWINEGAAWGAITAPISEKPWTYRRPVAKPGGSIDEFVDDQLTQKGLKAAPKADHETLIRRIALDLTGLPPEANDFALTYEQAVTKYLASPHYGERWGRHWLDVARYADSNGYEHDFNRPNAWRYRDYVIQAFNSNKPFDRFLHEQIAGDELEPASPETLIATGFLRSYAKVGFREKDNPEFRGEYIDDMIATLGRGVMGLTIQCARCHNHKFDPIAKADYERIKSILWGYVEVDHPLVPADQAEHWRTANDQVDQQLKAVRLELATLEKPFKDQLMPAKLAKFPKHILDAVAVPEEKRTPGQVLLANQVLRTTNVSSAEAAKIMPAAQLAARQQLLDRIAKIEAQRPAPIPVAMGITDGDFRFTPDGPGDEPAPGKGIQRAAIEGSFLHRGAGRYQVPPGEDVPPGFPLALVSKQAPFELPPSHGHTSGRRRALAEWMTSPEHPLTARVFVNRIWHHHFGRGIVASLDNFGKMGEAPTHPELLDWLAVRFVESGWDVKKLHRMILLSDAYQRSAGFDDAGNQMKDAANDYLWRFRAQRLEAEVVRDQILAAAGSLNRAFGGPAVFPPLPAESLAQMKNGIWEKQEDGPATWRRSVYVYRKRGLPFPLFEVFDLPDQNITCNRRNTTTVPTQALTLLNNDFVLKQASRLAARISEQTMDPARRVEMVYQATVARAPRPAERELALKYLATGELAGLAHVLFNTSEFLYLR